MDGLSDIDFVKRIDDVGFNYDDADADKIVDRLTTVAGTALARVAELEALLETKTALCDELGEALPQTYLDRDIARGRAAKLETLLGQARDALRPVRVWNDDHREKPTLAEIDFCARVHAALSEELKTQVHDHG